MDLLEYKTQAFRVLNGLMDSFSDEDGEEEFICPLLEYFWPRLNESLLPNNGLEGVLVLQDWGNSKQSSRAAKANVKHATSARVLDRQQSDPTLFNLFRSESNWRKPLLEGGWIAMNAVWGTRLSEDAEEADKNKCLPNKIHYPAFAIWGRIIRDLHLNCAFKQLVLAGAWARFETQDEVDRRLSGRKYFEQWSKKISASRIDENKKKVSREIAEELKELPDLTIYLADHPSTWKYGYTGQVGPPLGSILGTRRFCVQPKLNGARYKAARQKNRAVSAARSPAQNNSQSGSSKI